MKMGKIALWIAIIAGTIVIYEFLERKNIIKRI